MSAEPTRLSTASWVEGEDVRVETNLRYGHDQPVDVVVRKRGRASTSPMGDER